MAMHVIKKVNAKIKFVYRKRVFFGYAGLHAKTFILIFQSMILNILNIMSTFMFLTVYDYMNI